MEKLDEIEKYLSYQK